jgi:hypothetical protein
MAARSAGGAAGARRAAALVSGQYPTQRRKLVPGPALSRRRGARFCLVQAIDELLLPPLAMRAASSREPTDDLEQPVFNSAVVPLLLYPMWQENFGACAALLLARAFKGRLGYEGMLRVREARGSWQQYVMGTGETWHLPWGCASCCLLSNHHWLGASPP